jgi:enhancing lycopene biosynthesis protein 2
LSLFKFAAKYSVVMKKIGVLLSGCGVYDGAEIQEAVFTLLAIEELGAEAVCIGIDKDQHHVVNHTNGEEMAENRNMLVEAARIARGKIKDINEIEPNDIDALVIPGGFGSAKNFTKWAFEGPEGAILPEVKLLLVNLVNIGKPICALCVSPVVVAKALENSKVRANVTIGSTEAASEYDIAGFRAGLETTGTLTENKLITEIQIDHENRIVSAPCYMMETGLVDLKSNIYMAIEATLGLIE